ncbi:MAG: helix-turn-helix domain-containing protein [Brevundimonas sp.]
MSSVSAAVSQPTTDARKPMMNHQALQRVPDGGSGPGAAISSLGSASFSGLVEGSRESGRTGRGARAMTVSGVTDLGPVPEHTLCIHLGRPTLVNCRLDDLMQNSRRQARGDMDIVPLGSSICWETEEDAPLLLLQVSSVALASAAAQLGLDPCHAGLAAQLQVRDMLLERIMMAIESTLLAGGAIDPLLFDSLSLAATARLLQRFADAPPPRPLQALAPRKLRRVLEHVEAHLGERLSVARLAEVAGASPSHFAALFRRSTGESVHQYVLGRRIERARTLLMINGVSISQTALEAGFAHQSHMASCMKRALGLTPRELAKLGDEVTTAGRRAP